MRPSKSSHRSRKFLGAVFALAVLAGCSDSALETVDAPELSPSHYGYTASRDLVALDDHNRLLLFNTRAPDRARWRQVQGVRGTLLGIDYRPANGLLYGLSSSSELYTIDPSTGRATFVSSLSVPFEGGSFSGVDFNPVADRLRVTGANDQNFRVNVDTGEVTLDGPLAYAGDDRNRGQNPFVTASAYTDSFAGTTTTALYNIDSRLDVVVLQNPPNDGTLTTVGKLGVNVGKVAGFDIVTATDTKRGRYGERSANTGYAVAKSRLYTIDLATGKASRLGRLPKGNYRGLTAVIKVRDNTPRDMVALGKHNTLVLFNSANPENTTTRRARGVRGELLGIDYRPADGKLYGLASSDRLYTLDLATGRATQVSRLGVSFSGGTRSGVDFNPVADRLRVTGSNDQNLRVNVDTGETLVDGTLAYATGDVNEGKNPTVVASAYTDSFAGTTTTALYNIDSRLDVVVLQNPPNAGTLQTVGALGIDVSADVGFDIVTDTTATASPNVAYALADGKLYQVNLATGAATGLGRVPGGSYFGLAVIP